MKKVIVILGPTGTGKTKLSIALAKSLGGEIINGDSMQGYIGMDIGTAKISEEEKENIPHHLFDILEVHQANSISDNQKRMREKIEQIPIPIIVGGTGLYLKSALYDYHFADENTRDSSIEEKYRDFTCQELHAVLATLDEVSAAKIHPNNRRRVLRAIELYHLNGESKSQLEAKQEHKCLYDVLFIGLKLDREILYPLVDIRVDQMMVNGLLAEVEKLQQIPNFWNTTASQAIGYKEFLPYFKKEASIEDVVEQIKIHTHQYIKRQYTWFNHQLPVHWLDVNLENFQETIEEALQLCKQLLVE